MGQFDGHLKELIQSKSSLDKIGNAIPAKDKADIAKNLQNVTAAMQKCIAGAHQFQKYQDQANKLKKAYDDYMKTFPNFDALDKAVSALNDSTSKFEGTVRKLADDLKKKKDTKNGKILDDVADAFLGIYRDTSSLVIFRASA